MHACADHAQHCAGAAAAIRLKLRFTYPELVGHHTGSGQHSTSDFGVDRAFWRGPGEGPISQLVVSELQVAREDTESMESILM